ncbi:Fe-S protein maturation auxiliary factor SufT [Georgfuchsia toluolica]|uniref:Fe-S protein maturation auxiliary factor SufT n=1 Tax=Georgfuchsia toluolica TaxID=424218 RepID=A0A916J6Z2_9PROT|nr:metal-sulfur cluster assembly factor [Georgfuchsia toluolica]CAG4885082.1 Fe-S protein maturation auxiliary factor SufT [Georgfuchsia toluolica]
MANSESAPDPDEIRNALLQVVDPEAGMNIVDLGLIYRIEVAADMVTVEMTMTSPACPMGDMITAEVEQVLRELLPDSVRCDVRLVWSPAWDPSLMSEQARQHFGW